MTGKERARLRSMANGIDAILQVGKSGISDQTVRQVDDALAARELIKLSALETSPLTAREASYQLAEATQAEVVQVIGRRFVLYRKKPEERKKAAVKPVSAGLVAGRRRSAEPRNPFQGARLLGADPKKRTKPSAIRSIGKQGRKSGKQTAL